jgi:hypothetical protein
VRGTGYRLFTSPVMTDELLVSSVLKTYRFAQGTFHALVSQEEGGESARD